MKRYWKLIIMAIVVVLCVGTFYIKSAISASEYPEFVIQKQSGNEKEVEPVLISAFYQKGSINESLRIDSNGSEYQGEASFLDRINHVYLPVEIKQLQKEHRSFMRSKSSDISTFYEDEDMIAYADISYKTLGVGPSDFHFQIATFDKKEKKKTSIKLPVPNEANYSNMYVQDVQMVGKQLKVITQNYNNGKSAKADSNNQETHVYSIDMSKKKIMSDEIILTVPDSNGYIEMLTSGNTIKPTKYVIFNHQVSKLVSQDDGSMVEENGTSKLIAYNFETKTKEEIKLPKELQESGKVISYEGSIIYFTEKNESGLKVLSYDLESKKVESNFNIHLPQSEEGGDLPVRIKNGKAYLLTPSVDFEKGTGTSITIVDLKTGKVLYKGKVVDGKNKNDKENDSLNTYELEIQ